VAKNPANSKTLDSSPSRHPYKTPKLTEYGSVAKLTAGQGSLLADGGSGIAKKPCI